MARQRIVETNEGIQDKLTVEVYDEFSKNMRDKGWNNVDAFIKAGIIGGNVLEIGPGPGYAGLEWLKATADSNLTGCEISREMIKLAEKNSREYGFEAKTNYVEANCMKIPFPDGSFDAVFSNGSLHEWEEPIKVFNEINRVLKANGIFYISDMRRDVNPLIKWLIYLIAKPKEVRPGFLTSLNASYTVDEMKSLIGQSALRSAAVIKDFFGLSISGKKK
ncbi:MAG TPA: class I SAM-dependent methyltransferase [Desulfitobacteriaceae bacterium]|jgi:ubiquinone/menaquinone biosynthesis C-methylase UbiE|nr:class I SAM-dependent methyltransferase [Desulfitobacteriaceae bacterium]